MGIASADGAGPAANEGRIDLLTPTERLVGDAGRLDRAIGGLRHSKMRCGHSLAVRVGAIEKCGHMARRRAPPEGSMWSHFPILAYGRTLSGRDSEEHEEVFRH